MRKILALIFSMSVISLYSMNEKKVRIYHCTKPENIEKILAEGLKSREQLEREGVKEKSGLLFSDHTRNIYFQYIDPKKLRKIKPGVWQDNLCEQCIAIEVDPDSTIVYNPELRLCHPFTRDGMPTIGTYKASGMTLSQYIVARQEYEKAKCDTGTMLIPHPYTAKPLCVSFETINNYQPYCWNEHTIQRDKIDPSEFVQ